MTSIVLAVTGTLAAVAAAAAVAYFLLRRTIELPAPPAAPPGATPIGRELEYRVEQWDATVATVDATRGSSPSYRGWVPVQTAASYPEAEGRLRALVDASGRPAEFRLLVGFPASAAPAADPAVPFVGQLPPPVKEPPMPAPEPPSLYAQLGGTDALRAVVKDFYRRMLDDQRFSAKLLLVDMSQLMRHQVLVWTILTGGPNPDGYTTTQLHEWVKQAHVTMRLSDADFAAMAGHLLDAAAGCGVEPAHLQILGEVAGTFREDIVSAES